MLLKMGLLEKARSALFCMFCLSLKCYELYRSIVDLFLDIALSLLVRLLALATGETGLCVLAVSLATPSKTVLTYFLAY